MSRKYEPGRLSFGKRQRIRGLLQSIANMAVDAQDTTDIESLLDTFSDLESDIETGLGILNAAASAADSRQKHDDDGQEYGHPGDYLKGLE